MDLDWPTSCQWSHPSSQQSIAVNSRLSLGDYQCCALTVQFVEPRPAPCSHHALAKCCVPKHGNGGGAGSASRVLITGCIAWVQHSMPGGFPPWLLRCIARKLWVLDGWAWLCAALGRLVLHSHQHCSPFSVFMLVV